MKKSKVKKEKVESKTNKNIKQKGKKRKKTALFWILGVSSFAVLSLFLCQFIFVDDVSNATTFMKNTKINGVDVSGMTQKQAENIVSFNLLNHRDDVQLNLKYKDEEWSFSGSDFEIANDIEKRVQEVFQTGRTGNVFQKRKMKREVTKNGLNLNVSYKTVLGGVDQKLDELIEEIEQEKTEPQIIFTPDEEEIFKIQPAKNEIRVDKEKFFNQIDNELAVNMTAKIEIPTVETVNEVDEKLILDRLGLRAKFSTDYSKSNNNRKSNIQKALRSFNGMVVVPGQAISFNETTGPRTTENGYKKANIILNGVYVEGAGGGVCQASTTLYNAVVLCGLDVVDISNHSLPASYVPLSFDAMVSEGTSDLIFVNNYDFPVYIRTYGNDMNAIVEIYGDRLEEGEEIKTRAELVKILPHGGDKIIPDTNGEYEQYVVYKGEFHRVKFPKEGYESKGFIQFYQDGEMIEEKQIRHDYYLSQDGIIVEGVESVPEGITLPENNVSFIPPQKVNTESITSIKKKIESNNPTPVSP